MRLVKHGSVIVLFLVQLFVPPLLKAGPHDSSDQEPTDPGSSGGGPVGEGETCSQAIQISDVKYQAEVVTNGKRNDLDWQAASLLGAPANGPDVVLAFEGLRWGTYAEVEWSGDFNAAVYVLFDDCQRDCNAAGTGDLVRLQFSTPFNYAQERSRMQYYIVIDGLDGAHGSGTVKLDWSEGVPTLQQTWGRVKTLYR